MNDFFFHSQETDTKKPVGFFAILHWFARLILLAEEEKGTTGIYVESQSDSRYKEKEKEQNGPQ